MIRFNKASITELEKRNVIDAMENSILSGDGKYTSKVYEQFKDRFGISNMLLTTSGTTALEMASILIELEPGDEIIVPSLLFHQQSMHSCYGVQSLFFVISVRTQ